MSQVARYFGKDDVLETFDKKAKTPFFSLWIKSRLVDSYDGDDMQEAREILEDQLDRSIKKNENFVFNLILHSEKSKNYTQRSPQYCSIYYQPFDNMPAQNIGGDVNAILLNEINNLKAELHALKMKQDNEDEDEDEEEDEDSTINGVERILNHPLVSNFVANLITNGNSQRVTNLAGTSEDIDECVQMLFKKGVTIEHLRKLAEMPTAKIQMLLTML